MDIKNSFLRHYFCHPLGELWTGTDHSWLSTYEFDITCGSSMMEQLETRHETHLKPVGFCFLGAKKTKSGVFSVLN